MTGDGPRPADGQDADVQDYAGTPQPDAIVPALNKDQLAVLGEVGREWDRVSASPQAWRQALPIDPALGEYPTASEFRPARFTRFVPVSGRDGQLPPIETTRASEQAPTAAARIGQAVTRLLIGPPLDVSAIAAERMRKLVALPVLSADALSSVAYGPEAMLAILVLAGLPGLSYSVPVGVAIVFLMLAVGISYRQTIRAYPQGGGSYIVASHNLGQMAGLTAAAGLLIDYVMTVAVSIASGVAAMTSAYPSLQPSATWIGVGVIAVLLGGNLRGVRQAGALFAAPTYAFIAAIAALVIAGLVHAAGRGFHPAPVPHLTATEAVSVLLVLRAFSSGATAMTGMEAISNAVPAFKPVEWRNARITLSLMVGLLIAMFIGVLAVARLAGVVPEASQTMLSQLAHLYYGDGPVYIFMQAATALVLLLAANTSYNDFPRVMFLLARDRLAPRSFLQIGDRLTFRHGIVVLSVTSAVLYIMFSGNTGRLLPLYAVGVFLSFTLSQAGMVVHWRRHRDQPHWRRSLVFNAIGAVLSGIVFVIAGITKFTAGAWVAIVLIMLIVVTALRVRRYYDLAGQQLALRPEEGGLAPPRALASPRMPSGRPGRGGSEAAGADGPADEAAEDPRQISNLIIVPVIGLDRASMRALAYAAVLGQPVFALHISPTADEAERFRGYWQTWGNHLPLEVIVSPHRALVAPLVNYIWTLHGQRPDLTLTVIVPEIVTRHWWHQILHDHVASRLQRALRNLPGVVVTSVPFHLAH
ncbi:MAG TPA: APC family permease [Trebonia sp.]|nr:APC family permease [Trebonia sp.]